LIKRRGSGRPTDVSRMFGNVFLSHPSLKKIRLEDCTLPSSYLKLLASTPPASRLRELELSCCEVDTTGLSHLASMIRGNAPLRHLTVQPKGQGLDPDDCRLLCESVCHNRYLRWLDITVSAIRADTLERVAESPASPLRSLCVTSNDFTEEGVQSLIGQLRTNTQMYEMHLSGTKGDALASLEQALGETVRAYNYMLRRVHLNRHQFFPTMRRNRWIRTAVRRLEPRDYRVTPVGCGRTRSGR
jgi:Leucine Rich repeat